MSKDFSKQLGSMLAYIQDLVDTIIQGAFKSTSGKNKNSILSNIKETGEAYYETYTEIKKSKDTRMAVSRFHNLADTDIFAKTNNISKVVSMGSALKYVRIALGEIDVYPRLVGSSEWDTAAGQAVLEAAGGYLLDWHTKMPLRYGKSNRRNGRMIAFRVPYGRNDFILQNYKPGLL